jgi:hypothetical protein
MPIKEYFSSSYAEARAKFVDAARNGEAELVSYRLPGYSGPRGEDLAVDVARLRSANAHHNALSKRFHCARILIAGTGGTIWRVAYIGKRDRASERPDSARSAQKDGNR